jgi:hypothetical protein
MCWRIEVLLLAQGRQLGSNRVVQATQAVSACTSGIQRVSSSCITPCVSARLFGQPLLERGSFGVHVGEDGGDGGLLAGLRKTKYEFPQVRFFNGHYDTWCYLPLMAFVTFNDEREQYLCPAVLGRGGVSERAVPRAL